MDACRISRLASVPMLVLLSAVLAGAQPLGSYRWQQQPYCNVLTLNVVQVGVIYQLDGSDDQCGAATRAAVVGIAFLNPNGTVGMGLTVVTTPGGTPLHIDATLSLATISGTWRDNTGNTGPFTLTPAGGYPAARGRRHGRCSLPGCRLAAPPSSMWLLLSRRRMPLPGDTLTASASARPTSAKCRWSCLWQIRVTALLYSLPHN